MPRPVAQQLEAFEHAALMQSGRVRAGALVAHVALERVAALSAEEAQWALFCPHGAPRYRLIVDQFTGMAAGRIAELGW